MRWLHATVAVAGLASAAVNAFEIRYAADRDDALKACDAARYAAQPEAANCYQRLIGASDDARVRAAASHELGELSAANTYFQTAIEQFPEDAALRSMWGDVYRAAHQDNEAVKLYQEALALDPEYRPAMRGLVKIAAQGFSDQANDWLDAILDLEGRDVEAHILKARLQLEDGAVDEAAEVLDRALLLAAEQGVTPLEIYALLAAVDLLRGITESEWTAMGIALNPGYGEIHATPAHFYIITRRYREAVELLRLAVAAEPTLWSAHAELGVNLLRDNRIAEATRHLQTAYVGDRFSTVVVNTLRLLDSLDNFNFTAHGEMQVDGVTVPQIYLRMHKDEGAILEPYVLRLIRDSIAAFSERYAFALREPVIIELYPEHDDFAVRTAGLPGIGLLGVTFGYLVAMDSPTGRAPGEFHWGTTLWHEMAHIFTLEATDHLVPRWFSEGVSVHEEWATGPLPGRHIALSFFEAMDDDRLLPIAELDRGFIRPTYQAQVIVSYMQAGLICNFISNTFGQDRLAAMLHAYTTGATTPEALETATGLTTAEFDARFERHLEELFGDLLENYPAWQAAQEQAIEAAGNGDWPAAETAAREAIRLFPDYVDEGSAYIVLARALREQERVADATATVEEYFTRGGFDPEALYQLARWRHAADDVSGAVEVLLALNNVVPIREDLHTDLGDWLLALGRGERALEEYAAMLAMEPHDRAAAYLRMARAHAALGNADRSREQLLYALEIAPNYPEAQDMLLEILR